MARRRVRSGIYKEPDLALLALHHGTPPAHLTRLRQIRNRLREPSSNPPGSGKDMTWGKGYSQDGSPSQSWQVWRGSMGSSPMETGQFTAQWGQSQDQRWWKGQDSREGLPCVRQGNACRSFAAGGAFFTGGWTAERVAAGHQPGPQTGGKPPRRSRSGRSGKPISRLRIPGSATVSPRT